jgi:hypothetical protein
MAHDYLSKLPRLEKKKHQLGFSTEATCSLGNEGTLSARVGGIDSIGS